MLEITVGFFVIMVREKKLFASSLEFLWGKKIVWVEKICWLTLITDGVEVAIF
jgi:hypothetical protein